MRFLNKIIALKKVEFANDLAEFYLAKDVDISVAPSASVRVAGKVTIGFPLPATTHYPSYNRSVLRLDEGAKLICDGNVHIANGCSILIGRGGVLHFKGGNFLAHNCTILCKERIEVGKNTSISWNFTGIDDDGHRFFDLDGKIKSRRTRPVIVGDNVAIQINACIPKGVTIGDGAIIGAGTYVREDVPAGCLYYSNPTVCKKEGVTFGFQFLQP